MKIGFLVTQSNEMFNNGCNQQAYFVLKTMENIPECECYLLCTHNDMDNTSDQFLDIPIHCFEDNLNIVSELDILICLSKYFSDPDAINYIKNLNIKTVYYNCGNIFYIFQEDIITDKHNFINDLEYNKLYDNYWIIPNYTKDIHFYKYLTGNIPVNVAPYVWDTQIVSLYDKKLGVCYDPNINNSSDKYILIAEPNTQTTKTCLIPLLICDELYKTCKNIKVLCLCKPDTNAFSKLCDNLEIHKNNVVEYYSRRIFLETIYEMKKNGLDLYILSHQKDNPLNFLHLETLSMSYPLIHNCEEYSDAGYYYNNDIYEGVKQLQLAFRSHSTNLDNYRNESIKVLTRFSPKNDKNINIYHNYLNKLLYSDINVNIFLICYNEETLITHAIEHYRQKLPGCNITIYDNMSTDNSVDIAKQMGCNVIPFDTDDEYDESVIIKIKNNCWKHIQKGWIIVADMDEFLDITLKDLMNETKNGSTILNIKGYQMIGESKTTDLSDIEIDKINKCVEYDLENKKLCFLRDSIEEINYTGGAHFCHPKGEKIQYSDKVYKNKHMKYLGLPYFLEKNIVNYERTHRMREEKNMSTHLLGDDSINKKKYFDYLSESKALN